MSNGDRTRMKDLIRAQLTHRPPPPHDDVETLACCALGQRLVGSTEVYPEWMRGVSDEQLAAWLAQAYVYQPTGSELTHEPQFRRVIPRAFDDSTESPPSDDDLAILVRLTQHVLSRRAAYPPAARIVVAQAVANLFRNGRDGG